MNNTLDVVIDVIIVGGGPAGLSAALALGRARKRVLVCDAGPRRNAAAVHVHNFLTRDGITPDELRRIGREQLAPYASVAVDDVGVVRIDGARDAFRVTLTSGVVVDARRVLLCTGMLDEIPDIDGARALWGRSIFQCPYCHGWEAQNRRWGYLAHSVEWLEFALLLRGWTDDVAVFTNGRFAVPDDVRARLAKGGVQIEERSITRLVAGTSADQLARVDVDGGAVPLEVLFTHPRQRQVDVVTALGLTLDPMGFVVVDPMRGETSTPGISAAGDLTTPAQGAILAASQGMMAAAKLNHELTIASLA